MNTYKIKAVSSRNYTGIKLEFTVEAETLAQAEGAARQKLKREGYKYGEVDSVTELGQVKGSSPAKPEPRWEGDSATKTKYHPDTSICYHNPPCLSSELLRPDRETSPAKTETYRCACNIIFGCGGKVEKANTLCSNCETFGCKIL